MMNPLYFLWWSGGFALINYTSTGENRSALFFARLNLLLFLGGSIMDCVK